jgi:OmpA-OmpF porin, OOP family
MKKVAFIVFVFISVFAIPAMLYAEIKEGSFEVNPYVGYYFPSADRADKGASGLRLGYNFTKNWGFEGVYDHLASKAELYHANALYHFMPEGAFNPFVTAGIGDAFIKDGTRNKFMGDVGIGVKYFFSDRIAARVDVREVMTQFSSVLATAGITFTFGGKTPQAVPAPPPPPPPPPAPEVKPTPLPPVPEEKPAPPPAPAPAKEVKILLEDIHFEFDKATLTAAAREILDDNLRVIGDNRGIRVQIEGHGCAHGPEKYNMALSERRANAVKEYLVKGGVEADKLTTIAYGETRLAMPEIPTPRNKESIEARTNRRVHFEVIMK